MEFGGVRFPARVHIKINAMKIKLNRDLWNHKSGEEIDVPEPNAIWAVKKGYAEVVIEVQSNKQALTSDQMQNITVTIEGRKLAQVLNKAIEPNYKRNKIK